MISGRCRSTARCSFLCNGCNECNRSRNETNRVEGPTRRARRPLVHPVAARRPQRPEPFALARCNTPVHTSGNRKERVVMLVLVLAFLGGMLTILSPCILPIIPLVFARSERNFTREIA